MGNIGLTWDMYMKEPTELIEMNNERIAMTKELDKCYDEIRDYDEYQMTRQFETRIRMLEKDLEFCDKFIKVNFNFLRNFYRKKLKKL